jgi:glycosyl transferase family 11
MDHKLFLIAFRCGRLANRLVLFANFIAFAEEHGCRVMNFTFHSYAHLFDTTRRDIYCQYPAPTQKSWLDSIPTVAEGIRRTRLFYHAVRAASRLNESLPIFGRSTITLRESKGKEITLLDGPEVQAQINEARTVFVYGWNFRAPGCAQRHVEKIRSYFKPLETHERSINQVVACLRQHADILVGVHIRRGDYRGWKGGKYFFSVSRYANWMRELAEQFPGRKVSFLICSNEPRHAEEFPGLSVGFGTDVPVQDLYALAKCDYIVGPSSTFSQWASFYGNTPLLHLSDSTARIEPGKFRVSDLGYIPGYA